MVAEPGDPQRAEVILALEKLQAQNPRAFEEVLTFLVKPPVIGSVKLSFRDGRFNAAETVAQTY